jgi:hypothetical protein
MPAKQQQCPICLSTSTHTFPCEGGAPVLVEEVLSVTRGPVAKAMNDARIEAGIKVLFLASKTAIPYERLRDAMRGQGALSMVELDRVFSALNLTVVKAQ